MAAEGRSYRHGVRAIAPLTIAAAGFGVSFGLLARAAGWGWLAPIVMSATTFAGSAQFASASIMSAGGTVAAAIAAGLLLNARYAPIGVTVAPWLEGPVWSRLLRAQLVVDESWAIAAEGEGRYHPKVLVGAGVGLYVAWVAGTAIGSIGAQAIGDPSRFGLDAAFPALFLALLVPQVRDRLALSAALLGGAIALALTPMVPAGVPIVAASVACLLGVRR
jgi:4-azaleucine resistance transporter AzlC